MNLLAVEGVTKQFGQAVVVRAVTLAVAAGERHAIIGSNGAGKSSLFHMITGRLRPTAGRVHFRGVDITGLAPHRIARMGLARSFQITNIFPRLSVRENVRLGIQAQYLRQGGSAAAGRRSAADLGDRAEMLLAEVNLTATASTLAGTLSYGDQRRLEIALALALDPVFVLLDEPTAGMSIAASQEIVELLHRIPRAVTLLLIEHDIDLALRLSDRVTVMHQGEILAQGTPDEVVGNPQVQEAYFGGGAIPVAGRGA